MRMNLRADQQNSGDLSFVLGSGAILGINTSDGVTVVELGGLGGSGTIQRSGGTGGAATLVIGGKGTDSIFDGRVGSLELGVEKVGNGTLTLTGSNNDYAGGTTVTAGTLLVNGALTSSSNAVNVGLSGTLGGNGTIAGATTVNGNLTPGTSAGVLSFSSSLALMASSSTTMEITGTGMIRGTDYDGINVGSTLDLNGDLTLDLDTVFSAGIYTFNLFNAVGSTSGDFESVALSGAYGAEPMTFGSGVWSATTDVNGGETWSFSQSSGELTLTVIPEPRAALLGGLGLLMLLRRKRRCV
jgi:autotransporter-associated beta strand protein